MYTSPKFLKSLSSYLCHIILYVLNLLFYVVKAERKWVALVAKYLNGNNWKTACDKHICCWSYQRSSASLRPYRPILLEGRETQRGEAPPWHHVYIQGFALRRMRIWEAEQSPKLRDWRTYQFSTVAQGWWEDTNWNLGLTWEEDPGLHTKISVGTLKR